MVSRGDNRACRIINEAGAVNTASAFFILGEAAFKAGHESPCCVLEAPDDLMTEFRENNIKIGDDMGRKQGRIERQHAAERAHAEALKTKPIIGADGVPLARPAPLPVGQCLVRVVPSMYHHSGMWVFILEMLEWTAKAGIETHLVCKGEPGDIADIEGVTIHYCDRTDEAEKIVKALNPALIHSHSPKNERGIPPDFDRSRLVGTEHGSFDRNVTPQKPWVVSIVGRPDSVWHGVDLEQFTPPKRHRRGKLFRIGISGRVDATKYPDSFLKMLETAPFKGVQWTILGDVIGAPAKHSDVGDRLRAIPAINHRGWVARADMPGELRKLDALCVPSSHEPFGRQIAEAMACGLPVIARDVGGPAEIVGEGGILCSDDMTIFEAIKLLRDDKARWLELCKSARARAVECFDKKRVESDYQKIYQERSGGALRFNRVWAGMATMPGREATLKIAVDSILPQVDGLHVYCNEFEEAPECLRDRDKLTFTIGGENLGARGKFFKAKQHNGFFFSVDDDYEYPPDYVSRMIEIIERRGRNIHAGAMGFQVYPPIVNWPDDNTNLHERQVVFEQRIDGVDTASGAFHTSMLGDDDPLNFIEANNNCDQYFAGWCVKNKIERWVIAREPNWIKCNEAGQLTSIRLERQKRGWKKTTAIAQKIWSGKGSAAVLFRGNNGIGNFIRALPMLNQLERPIVFAIDTNNRWPGIQDLLNVEVRKMPKMDTIEQFSKFLNDKFDKIIAPWGGFPQIDNIIQPKTNRDPHKNEAEAYLDLIGEWERKPIAVNTHPYDLGNIGRPLVAIANGSYDIPEWMLKRLSQNHLKEIATSLVKYFDVHIVFLGSEGEAHYGKAIQSAAGNRCTNLAGKTTLAEAADVLKQADMAITNDTGLMHIADAVGTKTIALWGFTSLSKNKPWNGNTVDLVSDGGGCKHWPCWRTGAQRKCKESICMEAITTGNIIKEADKILSPPGYDAAQYWNERLGKYGVDDLQGPGMRGWSKEKGEKNYADAQKTLLQFCVNQGVDFAGKNVLEIGAGNGYYADVFEQRGAKSHAAQDITDVLFKELRQRHPESIYVHRDISEGIADGDFDVITMIDVTQHITSASKFAAAMGNIRNAMKPGSIFIVSSWLSPGAKNSSYERSHTLGEFISVFGYGFKFSEPIKFRDKFLFSITMVAKLDRITVSLATIPRRVGNLRRTVESLLPQVDQINVYLNGHDEIPSFLAHEKINVKHSFSNNGAAMKLHWANDPGYHLICDDDIVYPPDYAERMTAAVDRYDRKAICGVGALNFPDSFSDYFKDRIKYKYGAKLDRDTPVTLVCTGAMAFHSDLGLDGLKECLETPSQIDPDTALWAHRRAIPTVSVTRPNDWLELWIDRDGGLLERHKNDGARQTKIIKEILNDKISS